MKRIYDCKHCGKRITAESKNMIFRLKESDGKFFLVCFDCFNKIYPAEDRDDYDYQHLQEGYSNCLINAQCRRCHKTLKYDEFEKNCYVPQDATPKDIPKHWCDKCWQNLQAWIEKKNNETTKIYCTICKKEREMLVIELKKKESDFVETYICSNCKRRATIYKKKLTKVVH